MRDKISTGENLRNPALFNWLSSQILEIQELHVHFETSGIVDINIQSRLLVKQQILDELIKLIRILSTTGTQSSYV